MNLLILNEFVELKRGMISNRRPMQTNLNWLLILIHTSAVMLIFRQEDTFVLDF